MTTDDHPGPTPPTAFVSIKELIRRTGLSQATIYRMVEAGTIEKPRRLTANRVAWTEAQYEAWASTREMAA